MKTLWIDGQTIQAQAHLIGSDHPKHRLQRGLRLADFLKTAQAAGFRPQFVDKGGLDRKTLSGPGVLVVPTRFELPHTPAELDAIESFVEAGGGLWIMSNHAPYHRDNQGLAKRFGFELEGTFFHSAGATTLLGEELFDCGHPTVNGPAGMAVPLVTNTTDSIVPGEGKVVIRLPAGLTDRRENPLPSQGRVFAAAAQRGGRVFIMADSGMFGSPGADYPGYGLIDQGENLAFVKNVLAWL